ncbi:hypothetical protein DL98DRAFT_599223 [Cadophora sp. DSE1049]|nr:hypothetical protein DL98DRAFT_599223 [Cadophora sp. DSE1049]
MDVSHGRRGIFSRNRKEQQQNTSVSAIPARPKALENTVFKDVSVEVIQNIASRLPLSAAASFSLSCLALRDIMGTQYVKQISDWMESYRRRECIFTHFVTVLAFPRVVNMKDECYAFLLLLVRDISDQVPCFLCMKVHSLKNESTATNRKRKSKKRMPQRFYVAYDHVMELETALEQKFSTPLFQMVMTLFLGARDFDDLQAFLLPNSPKNCYRGRLSPERSTASALMSIIRPPFKVDVVKGSLLVCRRLIVPILPKPLQPDKDSTWRRNWLRICNHVVLVWKGLPNEDVMVHVELDTEREDWTEWKKLCEKRLLQHTSSPILRCPDCFTSYKLDFRRYEKQGTLAFYTVWTGLGQGLTSAHGNLFLCYMGSSDKCHNHSTGPR